MLLLCCAWFGAQFQHSPPVPTTVGGVGEPQIDGYGVWSGLVWCRICKYANMHWSVEEGEGSLTGCRDYAECEMLMLMVILILMVMGM